MIEWCLITREEVVARALPVVMLSDYRALFKTLDHYCRTLNFAQPPVRRSIAMLACTIETLCTNDPRMASQRMSTVRPAQLNSNLKRAQPIRMSLNAQ